MYLSLLFLLTEQRQNKTAIPVYTEMAARATISTSPPGCYDSLVG